MVAFSIRRGVWDAKSENQGPNNPTERFALGEKVEVSASWLGEEVRIRRTFFYIYEGQNYGFFFLFHASLDFPKFLQ